MEKPVYVPRVGVQGDADAQISSHVGIGVRIKHVRTTHKARKMSLREFAEPLGVAPNTLTRYESEARRPDAVFLTRLCTHYRINPSWLLTGEGPMQAGDTEQLPDLEAFALIPKVRAVLSAGGNAFVTDETVDTYYAFRKSWIRTIAPLDQLILLAVQGDSMEPTLKPGDLVMVDTQRNRITRTHIYALAIDDTIMVKRIQLLPGGRLQIINDNRELYDSFFVDPGHEQIRILGQVVWMARELV
jgi:phage repressor protein C with HTH and peptisase S24 domain